MKRFFVLDKFKGHKVEINIYIKSLDTLSTFTYDKFDWQINDNYLHLSDLNNRDCITSTEYSSITNVLPYGEDLYESLVDIKTELFSLSIRCAEEKQFCDKCHVVFKEHDPVWFVNQEGQYGSKYDGNQIDFKFCDNYLVRFIDSFS